MNACVITTRSLFGAAVLLCAAGGTCALPQTNLHGTVRDAAGAPLAGAAVKLTCAESSALNIETLADAQGTYRIAGLASCQYQIHAQLQQLVSSPKPLPVEIATKELQIDIELDVASTAEIPTNPDTPPRPTFSASGIRGLIDPGGYSAPANAAAASGLLSGMADVKRTGGSLGNACAARTLPALRSAHQAHPGNSAIAMDLAEALILTQQFDEADTLISRLPQPRGTSPTNLRKLRLTASIDEARGAFEAAAREYHLLGLAEPSAETTFAEGYEHILAGQVPAAASVFRGGLRLYPQSSALMIGAGTTEFLVGHAQNAVASLLQAAETDPGNTTPYPFLAAVSGVSATQGDRVIVAIKRHLALAPRDASAHLALAIQLLHTPARQGALADAEHELRQALGNDPALTEAHFQLAALLSGRGANEEAIRELELTVRLDPSRKEAHYRLALALRNAAQPEAAQREMQLFQQARTEDQAKGPDVRQYLSVMKQPADAHMQCPEE